MNKLPRFATPPEPHSRCLDFMPDVKPDRLALLVNSSDGFQDCWKPFFQLFERFGGNLRELPIYLNTERKDFAWPGLDVHPTCVWPKDEPTRPTWSKCFQRAVEMIPEPFILYFQEDYFLKRAIDSGAVSRALAAMEGDERAGVAYLFKVGPLYKRSLPYNDLFVEVVPPSRYLVSTQCAIWRKDFLLSLLRDWENGWMFEIFGSHRAGRAHRRFLAVRPDVAERAPVLDYVYTGVIKGRWKAECVPLFEQHGVEMDFARRGWYQESWPLKSKWEVTRKLTGDPRNLLRSMISVIEF